MWKKGVGVGRRQRWVEFDALKISLEIPEIFSLESSHAKNKYFHEKDLKMSLISKALSEKEITDLFNLEYDY